MLHGAARATCHVAWRCPRNIPRNTHATSTFSIVLATNGLERAFFRNLSLFDKRTHENLRFCTLRGVLRGMLRGCCVGCCVGSATQHGMLRGQRQRSSACHVARSCEGPQKCKAPWMCSQLRSRGCLQGLEWREQGLRRRLLSSV